MMKRFQMAVLSCVAFGCWQGYALGAETNKPSVEYRASAGPFTVEVVRYEWLDQRRERKVPSKIYFPKEGAGPFPVIIFSHGLGGSREGYEYLGRHWAASGYVSVHLQHPGSDNAVWEDVPATERAKALQRGAGNIANA